MKNEMVYNVREITNIRELLEGSFEANPDNIAFLWRTEGDGVSQILYHTLMEDVRGFATYLNAQGLEGKKIAVIGQNCYGWALTYLTVCAGTGIIVPLDKELRADEIEALLIDSEASAVVYADAMSEKLDACRVPTCTKINMKDIPDHVAEGLRLIEEGDRIAVGISGGKDSLCLLETLAEMRRFYPKHYELVAITVDMGFEGSDYSEIEEFCRRINVKYVIERTDIAKIVFDIRKEPNPCSLCAKLRRGSLHSAAQDQGCNKVALGHHFDDAVETFMMNLFFEGRLGCFSPKSYLSNRKLGLIRPLLYATEKDVVYFTNKRSLPVVKSLCPEDHATERENMKKLLSELEKNNKGLRHRIFRAMCKGEIDGFKIK